MQVRRTLLTGLAGLALFTSLAQPAAAEGTGIPTPGTAWLVDGDNAVSLDDVTDTVTRCGIGRSKLARTFRVDGISWEIYAITKACHEYVPTTRQFSLNNRIFVCEVAPDIEGSSCTAGTAKSGADVNLALSYVEFRSDGGNYRFHDSCTAPSQTIEDGAGFTCHTGPYTGAPGHCYAAWGFGLFFIDGSYTSMEEDRTSKSPETCVS